MVEVMKMLEKEGIILYKKFSKGMKFFISE